MSGVICSSESRTMSNMGAGHLSLLSRHAFWCTGRRKGKLQLDSPGSILNFPGSILAFPGSILAFPGSILAFTGSILAFPGSILAFPGSVLAFPGSILDFPGPILFQDRSFSRIDPGSSRIDPGFSRIDPEFSFPPTGKSKWSDEVDFCVFFVGGTGGSKETKLGKYFCKN